MSINSLNQVKADHAANLWGFPYIPVKMTYGDGNNNVLYGDPTRMEHIFGLGGDDAIYAGKNTFANGGIGNDVLIGSTGGFFYPEAGYDTIVLGGWSGVSRAAIFDFNAAQDKIQFDSSKFTGLAKGALSKDLFYIGEKGKNIWSPGAEDRFLYDKTNDTLEYRTEEGNLVDFMSLRTASNTPDPTHLNFFIV